MMPSGNHAVRLARVEPEAEVVLLDVLQPLASAAWVPPTAALHAEDLLAREERARDYLEGISRRLQGTGLRVRARVEIAATVASTILEVARGEGADVVALAANQARLRPVFLGGRGQVSRRTSPQP